MPIKFCSNCGNKITFELKTPEKCPKCGKELNAALKSFTKTSASTTYSSSSQIYVDQNRQLTNLEESEEINLELIDQIKANLIRSLNQSDVTVSDIPEFRISLDKVIGRDNKEQKS